MIRFYKLSRHELLKGDFPANHDTVLKVIYDGAFQFFTCKFEDSSEFVAIVSSLVPVRRVEVSSVDSFELCDFDQSQLSTVAQEILKKFL